MNQCFETTVDCCEVLTTTAKEFIDAMGKTCGMTKQGLMRIERCKQIIEERTNND